MQMISAFNTVNTTNPNFAAINYSDFTFYFRFNPWIEDNVGIEVDDLLNIAQRHIEQGCHITGNTFEIPDMGNGSG